MSEHCKTGLDDRCRDLDGEIRQKRGDTLVGTLRKTYGPDFAPGVRSDMHENYYAAFVIDPDGHNIEAVSHQPE